MIKSIITPDRVRRILDGATTEQDAVIALQRHNVKYSLRTDGGIFHIHIPARSGALAIVRTASRSAPLVILHKGPAPAGYPAPAPAPRY